MIKRENLGGGDGDNGKWGCGSRGGSVKLNGFIKILKNRALIDDGFIKILNLN